MKNLLRVPAVQYALAILLALISLACFAVPMYVIVPFKHQDPRQLAFALAVKQMGPWITVLCVLLSIVIASAIWLRRTRWFARTVAIFALAITVFGAYLARFNVYEQMMFHAIDSPQFVSAAKAKVDADDMVIAVAVNGVKRAYPIREMAYHHVANDVVGGEPIVATY